MGPPTSFQLKNQLDANNIDMPEGISNDPIISQSVARFGDNIIDVPAKRALS
jgi:hypothetical protein